MTIETQDSERPSSGGKLGCWMTGLTTIACAVTLICAGLFLPPVRLYDKLFGPQYTPLPQPSASISADGLTLMVLEGGDGTFGASVSAHEGSAPASGTRRPLTSTYELATTGTIPDRLEVALALPEGVNPVLVDVMGWDEGEAPAHLVAQARDQALVVTGDDLPQYMALYEAAAPTQPAVLVTYEVTQTLPPAVANAASVVAPSGLQPTTNGSLTGSLAPGFDLSAAYRVTPAVRNFADPRAVDTGTIETLLSTVALRNAHAAQLAAFASAGYDGVLIDYRDVPLEQRDNFSALIAAVSENLHNTGLLLGITLPMPARNAEGGWDTAGYDWPALGRFADFIQVRVDPTSDIWTGAAVSLDELQAWLIRQVDRAKLRITIPALSLREVNNTIAPIGLEQALSAMGDVTVEAASATVDGIISPGDTFRARLDGYTAVQGIDETTHLPYIDYSDESNSAVSRVWLTTASALNARFALIAPYAIGGVAFDDLINSGVAPGVVDAVATYRLGLPSAVTDEPLALRWTIENASGEREEVVTRLDEPLIATIAAPEGNYAVNAAIVSGGQAQAQRAGAAVAVFVPTMTYTPSPTFTPTPLPTATPTPPPAQVQVVSVPQSEVVAAGAPGSGSIVAGQFEYGGHVTSTQVNAIEQMRRAGMTWMKVQIRYFPGMSPSDAGNLVSEAHGRGFKLLLAIVGNPAELGAGGTGYMQGFAGFLASVAGYGPDAIEVWNEPNLDREWPEGQISGAMYAEMLRMAYTAIKGANSSVMVISGAPAPTGAEAAYPGRVRNDDAWVAELVAAGGLQYMDCLGAHYNEGIVGPTQNSGDPRDNYYTRYFPGMLNTYWSLIGGQRPICFTELGYLTPEGFPPLNEYFAWAQNVSLAQQAAWIAEAAALSSQSGRVRLMIIWNIDFTVYGSDPQAGYAIVRPGGGCPACDALAAAR